MFLFQEEVMAGSAQLLVLLQTIQNMNQKQREALVDLLLLGMFADGVERQRRPKITFGD